MLKDKHMKLDQEKIERAKRILRVRTETEAMEKALDRVIQADRTKSRKKRIMSRMIELRRSLGRLQEDSTEWVRQAREERAVSHGSSR